MLDNETLSAIGFFVAALIAGVWGYLKKPPTPPATTSGSTVLTTAIGLGWLEKDQAERMLATIDKTAKQQERMASALETLADKRTNEMKDAIEELMDVMREKEKRIRTLEGMRTRRSRTRNGE